MSRWNFHFLDRLQVRNEDLYGGVSLGKWVGILDYRNRLDGATSHSQAVCALQEAICKHVKGPASDDLKKNLNLLDLVVLRGHPSIAILTVAVISTSGSAGPDGVWALTHLLGDTRRWKLFDCDRAWIRRTAACGLCHVGTAPALIALLDGAPYESGVCREGLRLIRTRGPMIEVAPALSRFIRRRDIYYKETFEATNVLADMGPAALPQIEELLKSSSTDAQQRGLEAVYALGVSAAPLEGTLKTMFEQDVESIKSRIVELDLLRRFADKVTDVDDDPRGRDAQL